MSRPRMTPELAEQKAREDFLKEIRIQRAKLDMSQKDLGVQVGVSAPSMCELLADPDKIRVGSLRKMIRKFRLSPEVVLLALGYTRSEISRIGK